jgi:mTERF domain-containing protein
MRALEIRRKVTAEIFKEAMRKGKFGITYATNLTNRLGPFIDYVMVEAAAMKRFPEFSESTFNFRAKTVIQDSNVVPLIR